MLQPTAPPTAARAARPAPAPVAAKEKPQEPAITASEQAKIDKDEIKQIILEQIRATPKDVDEEWFADVFQYIPTEEAFRQYMDAALADGVKFDRMYSAEYLAANPRKAQPVTPGYYVSKASEHIYAATPIEKRLAVSARGLLDMALNREYITQEGWEGVRDDFLITYFKHKLRLYEELRELATGAGGESIAWHEDIARTHEAIVFHRFVTIKRSRDEARERHAGRGTSGKRIAVDVRQQQTAMNHHLLALGRLYVDAAIGETTYLGKQREYNERGFGLLAMVYQRTPSGEALDILIRANSIQRNQLWRMGKAHWKRASKAVAAGDSILAHEQYLQAKRRYLQSLSRIETSKKRRLLNEFVTLQKEINAWKQAARSDTVGSGAGAADTTSAS